MYVVSEYFLYLQCRKSCGKEIWKRFDVFSTKESRHSDVLEMMHGVLLWLDFTLTAYIPPKM
jgi:hypothetical protein